MTRRVVLRLSVCVCSTAMTKDFPMGLESAGEVMAKKLIVCSTAMTKAARP